MNPSEGSDQISKDLFNEDELGAVVRSHIRVESTLNSFVAKSVPKPEHLNKLTLDFDKTVSLALVLGLNEDYAKPLRALGNLRNNFAHKPDMHLSKEAVNNLYSQLSSEAKDLAQTTFQNLKKGNESMKQFRKLNDMPPSEQLKIIVINIWSRTHAAVMLLDRDKDA
jgi:hypothetical protein